MADDDRAEVDALAAQDVLRDETGACRRVGVDRDRRAGASFACAVARITRSTPGVSSVSIAHLRNAARMPVPAMPSSISRTNSRPSPRGRRAAFRDRGSGRSPGCRLGVDAGGDDDVQVDLLR